MNSPETFRLVDEVLEFHEAARITTLSRLHTRKRLLEHYGLCALIVEAAAQTCGLMSRIAARGQRECFLGKVRRMALHAMPEDLPCVRTSARTVSGSGELARYQGEVRQEGGGLLAEFDLLICSVETLGEGREERVAHWQKYIGELMKKRKDALHETD